MKVTLDSAESMRRQSLQKLVGELGRIGWWSLDVQSEAVVGSEGFFALLQLPEDYPLSLAALPLFFQAEEQAEISAYLQRCAEQGSSFEGEWQMRTAEGNLLWVEIRGVAERGPSGEVQFIQGTAQDISHLRHSSLWNQNMARTVRSALDTMSDGFILFDEELRYTYVNAVYEAMARKSRSEMLGRTVAQVFPDLNGSPLLERLGYARDQQVALTLDYFYASYDLWLELRIYPSKGGLAVYLRDITEKHVAAEALRSSEERFRLFTQAVRDAIYDWDITTGRMWRNEVYQTVYGFPAEEDECGGELTKISKERRSLTVEASWSLVRDEHGQPRSVLVIDTDVTEKRRLEQQFLRAQRLDSMGTLAGGIAHDLNNVLAPILLSIELLKESQPDPDSLEMLDTIEESARRGAQMVQQVLLFSRGVAVRRDPVSVTQVLADVMKFIEDTSCKNISLEGSWPAGLPCVCGDSTQLQQVLMNLCVNARDAMPEGGTLTLQASVESVASSPFRSAAGGEYVRLAVSDTGVGMPPDVLERIFEPFFTTKEIGKGTGLGLSTSAGIVQSHGGFIEVESAVGCGTTVSVYLPYCCSSQSPPNPVAPLVQTRGNGETILVVDDERPVREMVERTLRRHGYHTLTAADGLEAVTAYVKHQNRIAVVLTDLMMPVLDGHATIRSLREINPQVKIIAASGGECEPDSPVERFLPKPYSTQAVLEAVAELVAKAKTA